MTNRNMIKQSFELNNARYKLDAVELDIILKMISEIKNEDENFKEYRFKRSEIEQRLGKQLNKSSLKKTGESLMSKPLSIQRENGGFLIINWVSSFEYFSEVGEIEISFDPKLKPYLMDLQRNFVLTDLKEVLKLTSGYSKRLYMLFKQWIGMDQDKIIEVSELQDIFLVPKSLKRYADFKSKIIDKSLKMINDKTDLKVSYEAIKTGRSVTHLKFKIEKQIGQQLTFDDRAVIDTKQNNFKHQLKELGNFYFKGVAYKINDKGLLTKGRTILKTKKAVELLKMMQNNQNEIIPATAMGNIFDMYEKKA